MLTTFARIAKILRGLVEPRNWVEKVFSSVKTTPNDFEIYINGTPSLGTGRTTYTSDGEEWNTAYSKMTNLQAGDSGVLHFRLAEGYTKAIPVTVTSVANGRYRFDASGISDFKIVDNDLYFDTAKGTASSLNGRFDIFHYEIQHITE